MLAAAKYSSRLGNFQHRVLSLREIDSYMLPLTEEAGMTWVNAPDRATLEREIEQADIVHLQFWNNPQLYELLRSNLPPMRLVVWCHIAGNTCPQAIVPELIDYADFALACSPYTYEHPVFQNLSPEERSRKTGMVYGAADFARLANLQPQQHPTFNVGYIGHLSAAKMHPNYIAMSARVNIPNLKFTICGVGMQQQLQQQAAQLGVAERFDFRGYVADIKSAIETFDVYGYPLCENTYAASELNLQEAMYGGIPPVVFPYGGVKRLVVNNYTGLIVNSEFEYAQAIEYLYHNPEERLRLGRNAKEYAQQIFGAENAAKALNPIYDRLMQSPKRQREWGRLSGANLLDQPISLADLMGKPETLSGAELFIQSLGDTASFFTTSLKSSDLQELFAADRQIATVPAIVYSGEGGIFQYYGYYQNDGYLSFWSALVLQYLGDNSQAISLLTNAIQSGCNHWRLYWYLAQSADRENNWELAGQALQKIVNTVPEFTPAQKMLQDVKAKSILTLDCSVVNSSQVISAVDRYQQHPTDATNLEQLRQVRQQLANYWLNLPAEQLETAYTGDIGKAHQALWNSGFKHEEITEIDRALIQQIETNLAPGFDAPNAIQAFLAAALYCYPHQLTIQYQRAPIPNWLIPTYFQFMFESPRLFKDVGEVDRYFDYFSAWIGYLHNNITSNPNSDVWKYVANIFAQSANLTPLYFSDRHHKPVQTQRAEILEFFLTQLGCQLNYTFPDRPADRTRIRLGIVVQSFSLTAEASTVVPVFEQIDRDRFEVYLYTIDAGNSDGFVRNLGDKFTVLSGQDLLTMVQTVRSDDLDILLISSNITARSYPLTLLCLHRLARVQTTSLAAPVTTGMSQIDYYIAGTLTTPANAEAQYREKLVTVEGSGLCFRPLPEAPATIFPDRSSWGATADTIVFISGSNFRKINPEVRETWAKILAAVPNSILVLYPFGPNWGRHPQLEKPFFHQMHAVLAQHDVNPQRLILIKTLPSPADIRQCLTQADIYLDSYPYSGAASILDPLRMNLPAVVMAGDELRHCQSAAILQELQLRELVAHNETEYIQLAVALATNPQLRQEGRSIIAQRMQSNPGFLDSRTYATNMGQVFVQLFQGWQTSSTTPVASSTPAAVQPQLFAPIEVKPIEVKPIEVKPIEVKPIEVKPIEVKAVESAVNSPFLNRLIGCVNLYEIDPTNASIVAELHPLRQQLAESLLSVSTEDLATLYQGEEGKAYKALLKSGFQKEPIDKTTRAFVQQLTKQGAGLVAPQALNALMGAMLYYIPGTMQVKDAQTRLPSWLLPDYAQVFETVLPIEQQSVEIELALPIEFLNRLLGCANLYYIDPTEPSIVTELHELRRQVAQFWLELPPEELASVYKTEVGKRYKALLESGFQKETVLDRDRPFLQELTKLAADSSNVKSLNAMLGAMLYYAPGTMKVQNARTRLPGWLIEDYERVFELATSLT
jgi:predicted O-linked N-acetylglucosamine transferase (SPINDLY family)/glycosyltransferase involved in cell wall biosynthesis